MEEPKINPGYLPPDATEGELFVYLTGVRQKIKTWQSLHRESLLGKNLVYGLKAAANMAAAGESLVDSINDIIVEKCAMGD